MICILLQFNYYLVFVLLLFGCKRDSIDIIHQDIKLDGTNWEIYESTVIPYMKSGNRVLPIIYFGNDSFGIRTTCNHVSGLLAIKHTSLTFKDYVSTYMYCENKMDIEAYFMMNLKYINSYRYNNGILYLYIGDKNIGSFKRVMD